MIVTMYRIICQVSLAQKITVQPIAHTQPATARKGLPVLEMAQAKLSNMTLTSPKMKLDKKKSSS